MKLLALTFGDENCASTRYRLLQYLPLMEAEGITLDHTPAKSFDQWNALRDYDAVILQKTLLSRHDFVPSPCNPRHEFECKPGQRRKQYRYYDGYDASWCSEH